ncbi:hypothetical protein Psuf_066610 [Phytohabitans suffuscus]|uniref:Uncharacterized protein n=2 Tax=Phytohabitans suffuscus TaxID=624315 RepID=A0A6F8YTT3_9ACTN|nr:hypothetical protein Psuf_066610 [Phytohabitans suffuscus]
MTAEFGCTRCYGEDAAAALAHFRGGGFAHDHAIVRDSHFQVSLHHCTACGQRFVMIFTEFVAMSGDGGDPQYYDVVPVTADEAAQVRVKGGQVDKHYLEFLGSLGAGRRRLSSDWPGGGPGRHSWRVGTFHVVEGY